VGWVGGWVGGWVLHFLSVALCCNIPLNPQSTPPNPPSNPPTPQPAKKTAKKRWLLDLLDAVACGDEVPHGKPRPDVFLEAARRLGGADPAACLVFEDAPSGVEVGGAWWVGGGRGVLREGWRGARRHARGE